MVRPESLEGYRIKTFLAIAIRATSKITRNLRAIFFNIGLQRIQQLEPDKESRKNEKISSRPGTGMRNLGGCRISSAIRTQMQCRKHHLRKAHKGAMIFTWLREAFNPTAWPRTTAEHSPDRDHPHPAVDRNLAAA
jgi:hypothetical protein